MSRRGFTNSNDMPLGRPGEGGGLRSLAGSEGHSLLNPSYLSGGSNGSVSEYGGDNKRPLERESRTESREERRKKRKSRWEAEDAKVVIPGMPTTMPTGLDPKQEEGYLLQLQIEEISRRLRTGELNIPPNPEDRSPSPEPVYSQDGKRLNTREFRTRRKLEEQRHELVQKMRSINPDFKPPSDYRAASIKINDKVMIPQDENPHINFIGLLIGPRGNTLKMMEKETGAKIIIRGKGSVKEGKVPRIPGQMMPGEDEPLHAYIVSTDPDAVRRAVAKVKKVIQEGIDVPETDNTLRKNQLKELAMLNGTLRDENLLRCTNCGADNHRSWQCQDRPNVTNSLTCTACGGAGHLAIDCKQRRPGSNFDNMGGARPGGFAAKSMDEEYMSLMAELGEGPPPQPPSGPAASPGMASGGGGGRHSNGQQHARGYGGMMAPSYGRHDAADNHGGGGDWNRQQPPSNNSGSGSGWNRAPPPNHGNNQQNRWGGPGPRSYGGQGQGPQDDGGYGSPQNNWGRQGGGGHGFNGPPSHGYGQYGSPSGPPPQRGGGGGQGWRRGGGVPAPVPPPQGVPPPSSYGGSGRGQLSGLFGGAPPPPPPPPM